MREANIPEINRIFCEVLERQAFLLSDPIGIGDFRPTADVYFQSTMTFKGAAPGSLSLVSTRSMAREIAANVLGTETRDPAVEANYRDALGEILNVVCGHLLTALNGDHAIHDLSIPALREINPLQAGDMAGRPGWLAFAVEEHHALLFVDLLPLPGSGREESSR